MAKLTVNGIEITLSAKEHKSKKKFTLTGTYDPGTPAKHFKFTILNDTYKPTYKGDSIEITEITETKTTKTPNSTITIDHNGDYKKVWVWYNPNTNDSDVGGGDPTGSRGTEVTVKSSTGEY